MPIKDQRCGQPYVYQCAEQDSIPENGNPYD